MTHVQVLADKAAVQRAGAERAVASAERAIRERGRWSFVLSGGSTPGGLYELLAQAPLRERIDWGKVHIFWGDERCVPLDDAESCYRIAHEAMLSKVPIPPDQVYPFATMLPNRQEAADRYAALVRDYFGPDEACFDFVLLGMGPDGHTASLFPGHSSLDADEGTWAVVEPNSPKPPPLRLSLTLPLINQAREVVFLATGGDKAAALREVLHTPDSRLPAALVRPLAGELLWLVDEEAMGARGGERSEVRGQRLRLH